MENVYRLYDLLIKSDFPLQAPKVLSKSHRIEIKRGSSLFFQKIRPNLPSLQKTFYHTCKDGSFYIRFFNAGEYWIARNGKMILFHPLKNSRLSQNTSRYSPLLFLQTNVLSFSLLKLGIETLHASAIVIKGKAVGFIGESGYGKSTLCASFLESGFRLLTDDLLGVRRKKNDFWALPGTPQIKLVPGKHPGILTAKPLKTVSMNPKATKHIFLLAKKQTYPKPAPLKILYVLWPRQKFGWKSGDIRIRKLGRRDALMSLIRSTHNLVVQTPERLKQQLIFTAKIAKLTLIRSVSFPINTKKIPFLKNALLKDMHRHL